MMCDLCAMSFNKPVKPRYSFEDFIFKDRSNPDGWGLAFYPDQSAQIFKEPGMASKSKLARFLAKYGGIKSRIIISHVRAGSVGGKTRANTHPFSRIYNNQEWVLAHNGTIDPDKLDNRIKIGVYQAIGATDSERILCVLLDKLLQKKIKAVTINDFTYLADQLQEMNDFGRAGDVGRLNTIFSDGRYLFCYADKKWHNKLSFIKRESPFPDITLLDIKNACKNQGMPDEEAKEKYFIHLPEQKGGDERGFIIATTDRTGAPTDETWIPFKGGELIVFENGSMVYSNKRDPAFWNLSRLESKMLRCIRSSPEIGLDELISCLGESQEAIASSLHLLQDNGYIKEDSNAPGYFYTNPEKETGIDAFLEDTPEP